MMKNNIISLVFGIIALSFALSAVVSLIYLQQMNEMLPYATYNIDNPELFSQAMGAAKSIVYGIFAFFGIGCGLVALLVGRNGTEDSKMRKIGMIMGITGMVGTIVLFVISLL